MLSFQLYQLQKLTRQGEILHSIGTVAQQPHGNSYIFLMFAQQTRKFDRKPASRWGCKPHKYTHKYVFFVTCDV